MGLRYSGPHGNYPVYVCQADQHQYGGPRITARRYSYWRDFRPRDLYPTGVAGEIGVFALVTIDEQDDGWHICFMQDSGQESGSVTNAIERLATAVYREACGHALQRAPKERRLFRQLTRCSIWRNPAIPDPGRFHFYQHLRPGGRQREVFDCVTLSFERGEYRNPQWLGYQVIPELIQSARFDIARGATPSGAEGYRLAIGGRRRG